MNIKATSLSIIDSFSAHESNLSILKRKTDDIDGLNHLVEEACKSFQSLFESLAAYLAERQELQGNLEHVNETKLLDRVDRQKPALFMTPEEMTDELGFPTHVYASGCKCRTCSFRSSKWDTLDII